MVTYFLMRFGVEQGTYLTVAKYIYNFIVVLSVIVGLILVYRRLVALEEDRARLHRFFGIIVLIILPAGYISSRAANLFYYPFNLWSPGLLFEIITTRTHHTFHASIILPAVLIMALVAVMKFDFKRTVDTFFLYMPLGNAVGRVACFLVGCCWGNYVQLIHFHNPVPLYDIAYNVGIFFVLRKVHNGLYMPGGSQADPREKGTVAALYLVLYGACRFLMEYLRREEVVLWGLTQAQIAAIVFAVAGTLILGAIEIGKRRAPAATAVNPVRKERIMVTVFVAYFFFFFCIIAGLLYAGIVTWPLRPAVSALKQYLSVVWFLPVFFLETAALAFLAYGKQDIGRFFTVKLKYLRDPFFIAGAVISAAYSARLYINISAEDSIHGFAFWPPVALLCVLNAFAEEVFFRLVFYNLVKKAGVGTIAANIAQAALYASIHLAIAGPRFALMSLAYGLLMGYIFERTKSIVPSIICHIIVDIGAIGYPVLRYCSCMNH